ncbi:MAG: L7Ae/L30e/S12e/Gadd45 family ribosomal protein [Lentihominibacter sp.]|jgi:ribosomal protein L7Ae-like RNA K-turn-binding protein
MKSKVLKYMGFARKSGNLVSGVNTCTLNMSRGKVELVILAEDISEGSEKKIMKEIRKNNVKFVKYGKSEVMSQATGATGRQVFAVLDRNFADVILKEIDQS